MFSVHIQKNKFNKLHLGISHNQAKWDMQDHRH